jgi:DNA-binding winged helix-turn-helix (wHTH) protein
LGILRLLVVEGGVQAPICSDVREDWVRAPVSDDDLRARIAALRVKAEAHRLPQVDPHGLLRFGGRSTTVSRTETDLLECLVRQFGTLVPRATLRECLPERPGGVSRNALDLHIMRVRRRIEPLGLAIRTVWGRGYVLEAAEAQTGVAPRSPVATHPAESGRNGSPGGSHGTRGSHGSHGSRGSRGSRGDDAGNGGSRPMPASEVAALRWSQAHTLTAG